MTRSPALRVRRAATAALAAVALLAGCASPRGSVADVGVVHIDYTHWSSWEPGFRGDSGTLTLPAEAGATAHLQWSGTDLTFAVESAQPNEVVITTSEPIFPHDDPYRVWGEFETTFVLNTDIPYGFETASEDAGVRFDAILRDQ